MLAPSSLLLLLLLLSLVCGPMLGAAVAWDDSSNYVTAASSTLPYQGGVDILQLLNVSHGTPGVRVVAGAAPGVPAYRLRAAYARVQLPSPAPVTQLLRARRGFSLVFVYRQQRKSLGTLLSVHSPGKVSPWLQLTSNQRTGQLLLHYRLQGDAKLHALAWPQPPRKVSGAGGGWTRLSLSVAAPEGRVVLRLDCLEPLEQRLPSSGYLDVPQDALVYFRQEPGFKKKFLGTMQVAKILPYSEADSGAAALEGWDCDAPGVVAV